MAYLALLQACAVHIDGWEQILEQGGCQLQMLFTTKVVHHHQGGILHIKAGYLASPLFVELPLLCLLYSLDSLSDTAKEFRDDAFELMLRRLMGVIMNSASALSQGCCCTCLGLLLYLPKAVAVPAWGC